MSWRTTRASAQAGQPARHMAVIDLGSNSWRLVVFSYGEEGWWKRTDELYESVRIAEGMGKTGELQEPAIVRGLETLAVFERFCRASNLAEEHVHAIATSAIREAINRQAFLDRAREVSGFEIEILSAEAEAHYGYVAAINTSTLTDGVILDIGGGSLQLIEVENRLERNLASFPLGAVRMTERFLSDRDPARKKDLQKLRTHVEDAISSTKWLKGHGGRLVATGGAVRNLAAAAGHAALGPSGGIDLGVQGYVVTQEALKGL
ncbi:MAG TPA: hypothetical protein VG405_14075, partial [Solirubrobacteraceae bacterium]|nr:hypothetical protein [Solirubrobacteraceae bacterium]